MKNVFTGFALGFFGLAVAIIFWVLAVLSAVPSEHINRFLLAMAVIATAIMIWGPVLFWAIIPLSRWETRRKTVTKM